MAELADALGCFPGGAFNVPWRFESFRSSFYMRKIQITMIIKLKEKIKIKFLNIAISRLENIRRGIIISQDTSRVTNGDMG